MHYLDETTFDHDHHESGCDCGLCNGNGTSYGIALYELDQEGIEAYQAMQAGVDAEEFEHWVWNADPVDVFYDASEEAAVEDALIVAKRNGYLLAGIDPFTVTKQGPLWFLTNGLCESTSHWTPSQFDALFLSYQKETPWGIYPLTEQEARYIHAEGCTTERKGILRQGYSVLWQDKKWACPTIEYQFEDSNDPAEYEAFCEKQALWERILKPLGGHALAQYDSPLHDRYTLLLAVPFHSLFAHFASGHAWTTFLREPKRGNA